MWARYGRHLWAMNICYDVNKNTLLHPRFNRFNQASVFKTQFNTIFYQLRGENDIVKFCKLSRLR